jgi:hypothetical protein
VELKARLKETFATKTTSVDTAQQHASVLQEDVNKWEALYFDTAELGARSLERLEAKIESLEKERKILQEEHNRASVCSKGKQSICQRCRWLECLKRYHEINCWYERWNDRSDNNDFVVCLELSILESCV